MSRTEIIGVETPQVPAFKFAPYGLIENNIDS